MHERVLDREVKSVEVTLSWTPRYSWCRIHSKILITFSTVAVHFCVHARAHVYVSVYVCEIV